MRRALASRRILGLAVAVSVGTGVGLGVASLWPASGATTPQPARAEAAQHGPTLITTGPDGSTPAAPAASSTARLTLDQAKALALRVSPGRVVEVDQDDEDTGLEYEVTVLHTNGSATEVEVDAVTGHVVSTKTDDDWDGD